jgi:hypothetical protein
MAGRNKGIAVGSEVRAQTVIESVKLKRSSWTITTGRGFLA